MTLRIDGTLLLAGAGNMGSAMLAGWLERGLDPKRIIVQDPSPPPRAKELIAQARHRPAGERRRAARAAGRAGGRRQAAGHGSRCSRRWRSLSDTEHGRPVGCRRSPHRRLRAALCRKARAVVRCMPNTPSSIGRGITVAVGNAHVTPAQRATCDALLRAVGEVVWLDEEGLIDAVTAVSGSGPAYVFYLAECLAEAGVKAGSAAGAGAASSPAGRCPAPASCCTAPICRPTCCARTSPRPTAPPSPPCRC